MANVQQGMSNVQGGSVDPAFALRYGGQATAATITEYEFGGPSPRYPLSSPVIVHRKGEGGSMG
jgi:hypothetical protein